VSESFHPTAQVTPRRLSACSSVLLLVMAIFASCSQGSASSVPAEVLDADVYETCLRDFIVEYDVQDRASVLVVHESTVEVALPRARSHDAQYTLLKGRLPALRSDTFFDFVRKNVRADSRLPTSIDSTLPIKLLSEDARRRIFEIHKAAVGRVDPLKVAWHRFHQEFEGACGLLEFSRIGYSEQSDQALLHIYHTWDCLAGVGVYYILSRDATGWHVIAHIVGSYT